MSLLDNIAYIISAASCAFIGYRIYKSWAAAAILGLFGHAAGVILVIPVHCLLFTIIDSINKLTGEHLKTQGEVFHGSVYLVSTVILYTTIIIFLLRRKPAKPEEPTPAT